MRERLWPFVVGNNLFPIVLIGLAAIAYLKFARTETPALTKPGPVIQAPAPKYVERIIEKHHYLPAPGGWQVQFLPKEELEKARPGSVASDILHDNTSHIVARTEIPPSKGKTQVDAIRKEGADNVIRYRLDYRQLPPPFFDLKRELRGGIYGGFTSEGEQVLEGELSFRPLRIGPAETSVKGRIGFGNKDGAYGALLFGLEY